MQVGELFLALGLIVEDKQWSLGQEVINQMAAAMKRLAVNAVTATADSRKAMNLIGIEAPKQKTNLEKIAGAGEHVTSTFLRMAQAAAGFFALRGIKDMVTQVVDFGSKINDAAQATGLSAENLQIWGYAAKQNSSDIDGVILGTKKLSKGLDEMFHSQSPGDTPVGRALGELGISMNEPAVKARDLNGIMYLVANKFSTMPDGAKKTAASMNLFGKAGADLIPLLNNGVQGMQQYRQEADDLGIVMSGATVGALDDVGDNIDRVKAAWMGVKQQAVAALLPMLKDTVDSILAWVKANKELLASRIETVIGAVITGLKIMGKVLLFAIEHWKAIAAILAATTIVNGLMAIVKAIIFFQSAQAAAAGEAIIAWAAILGPILLVAAAVIALGALAYKFRDQIKAAFEKMAQLASDAWQGIKNGFRAAFDYVANLPVVRDLLDLVAALRDLTGIKKQFSTEHEQALEDEVRNPGSFRKAHPDAGGFFAEPGQSFDELNPGYAGATSAMNGPTVMNAPRSGATISNSYSVMINAGNANAKETADLVDQKLREHDERTRRQTAATLGV